MNIGPCEGLNLIPGEVVQIKNIFDSEDRVPVIGWRETICMPSIKKNILNDILDQKSVLLFALISSDTCK